MRFLINRSATLGENMGELCTSLLLTCGGYFRGLPPVNAGLIVGLARGTVEVVWSLDSFIIRGVVK